MSFIQRIETERDDATDLLENTVDQLLNFDCHSKTFDEMKSDPSALHVGILCENCQAKCDEESHPPPYKSKCMPCDSCLKKMRLIINSMKEKSAYHDDLSCDVHSPYFNHPMRSNAIDTLMYSHEFVLQMKRASVSAQHWLQSVKHPAEINIKNPDKENKKIELPLDVVALKAMLHSSQFTISRKDKEIIRLNKELSTCRAETGMLSSTSRPLAPQGCDKSISNLSSEDSLDNIIERNKSLVLFSPSCPALKLSGSCIM